MALTRAEKTERRKFTAKVKANKQAQDARAAPLRVGFWTIDDMVSVDQQDQHRVAPDDAELTVCGVHMYVEALEVHTDPAGQLFAGGPYDEKLTAALRLAQTDAPVTVRSRDGRRWLIIVSNMEALDV